MQIVHDIFPALIAIMPASDPTTVEDLRSRPNTPNSRQINTARIIITDSRAMVYTDSPNGPLKVFDEPYTFGAHYKNKDREGESYVTLDSGTKMAYRKDGTCGCGSRLRSMSIMRTLNSSQDPTE